MHFLLQTKIQSARKTTEVPNANNSNENRNETRRNHDITIADAMSNKLPAKLNGRSDTGDGLAYHINNLVWNSYYRRNESRLYGKSNGNNKVEQ